MQFRTSVTETHVLSLAAGLRQPVPSRKLNSGASSPSLPQPNSETVLSQTLFTGLDLQVVTGAKVPSFNKPREIYGGGEQRLGSAFFALLNASTQTQCLGLS